MRKQTIINAFSILKNQGIRAFIDRTKVHHRYMKQLRKNNSVHNFKDVLFINGCPIDYCERYRVHHKMEELEAYGLTVDEVTPEVLTEEIIKYYRCFVIYRMPWGEHIDTFVKLAKSYNKTVFFDIDDLVFDLQYTNNIKELDKLTKEQRREYDDGVVRYGKLLKCCDYSITTTAVIAKEMKKVVKDVCIDKNIASLTMQKYSELAIKEVEKNLEKVVIGYASGSITHNADFKLIAPALMKILDNYENVHLKLIGALEIPEGFKKYGNRVITSKFVDFTKLPYVLRTLDINLAPLEDTFFNSAKSSIKWMEAGFVKVATIASDVGNFHDSITDGVDGVLCKDNEWYEKLEKLVVDEEYRNDIANNAYYTVNNNYTAITSGKTVADFIKSKIKKNVCFIIPAANVSGGLLVTIKHAVMLKNAGYDVTLINSDLETSDVTKLYYGSEFVPVVSSKNSSLLQWIDVLVATMWFTVFDAISYGRCSKVKYLVQGMESYFYEPDNKERLMANSSYNLSNVEYLTVSKWCYDWLKNDFGVNPKYIPNGIDLNMFPFIERKKSEKIRILIEGDSNSYYKNVDESFKIVEKLDPNKFEIHYLSYNGKPKDWYRYDKFYNKIDYAEVYKIYHECDILLKSSILESFSYPPLEMMSTGGVCVVSPNNGNVEYLEDEKNCLLYKSGDIESAVELINKVASDKTLRNRLITGGKKTANSRSWNNIKDKIIHTYVD